MVHCCLWKWTEVWTLHGFEVGWVSVINFKLNYISKLIFENLSVSQKVIAKMDPFLGNEWENIIFKQNQ